MMSTSRSRSASRRFSQQALQSGVLLFEFTDAGGFMAVQAAEAAAVEGVLSPEAITR